MASLIQAARQLPGPLFLVNLTATMKTCFSIMPFKDGFEDIDRIIGEASKECGLDYVRGDRQHHPGSILPQILRNIREAAVVVADISGNNPNVFYELGIAHQILGPERVVILTQSPDESPYDVHEFRQVPYQHKEAGRAALRAVLPDCLRAALRTTTDHESWQVVRGRLPRTRLLARDLDRLVESAGPDGLQGSTIRMIAGLGSLAISDHEPPDPVHGVDYKEALLAERNSLRTALVSGARLKALLHPPRRFASAMVPERLRVRYRRMIGLLEGRSDITDHPAADDDVAAMNRCEFALTPVPPHNILIIGETVAYEGMKRGGTHGYEMTHCETSAEGLRELIQQFDQFFEASRNEMVRSHPPDGRLLEQLRGFLREAEENP